MTVFAQQTLLARQTVLAQQDEAVERTGIEAGVAKLLGIFASWFLVLAVGLLAAPEAAQAFEIKTGFSDACHESISVERADRTIVASDGIAIDSQVRVPSSETWEKLADLLLADLDVAYDNDREKFALVSLVLGSRYPDSGGTAVVNLSSSREMHVYSAAQEEHCLRSKQHDGPEGNVAALQETRAHIRDTLAQAVSYRDRSAKEQVITKKTFVELYGEVDMKVWAPAFYAGVALHSFQDCFSHTIRSADLDTILHVLNYTEAITEQYQPTRDGLAHSTAMDQCNGAAAQFADKASVATEDFLKAFGQIYNRQDPDAIEEVLDTWTSYRAGCTVENDICNSTWLDIAEQGQASPLFETPSCSAAGGHRSVGAGWMFLIVLAGLRLVARAGIRRG